MFINSNILLEIITLVQFTYIYIYMYRKVKPLGKLSTRNKIKKMSI